MNNKIKKILIPATCFLAGAGFFLTTSTEQTSALDLPELRSLPVIKIGTSNENTTFGNYFDDILSFLNEKIAQNNQKSEKLNENLWQLRQSIDLAEQKKLSQSAQSINLTKQKLADEQKLNKRIQQIIKDNKKLEKFNVDLMKFYRTENLTVGNLIQFTELIDNLRNYCISAYANNQLSKDFHDEITSDCFYLSHNILKPLRCNVSEFNQKLRNFNQNPAGLSPLILEASYRTQLIDSLFFQGNRNSVLLSQIRNVNHAFNDCFNFVLKVRQQGKGNWLVNISDIEQVIKVVLSKVAQNIIAIYNLCYHNPWLFLADNDQPHDAGAQTVRVRLHKLIQDAVAGIKEAQNVALHYNGILVHSKDIRNDSQQITKLLSKLKS